MNRSQLLNRKFIFPFLIMLVLMLPLYALTLQTIPNGGEQYYMIDVGEAQIVLNVWGTLHYTGYPLYVMIGNGLVALLRTVGVAPAAAPGITSLLYGVCALALIYILAVQCVSRPPIAALITGLFGLTRTFWIHCSIAEIYTFGLVLLALLLLLALWPEKMRGRIYWLALVGGIAVFHHRALLMVTPALVYAVWPEIRQNTWRRTLLLTLPLALIIGLLGFLPYIYLPLRANAGAAWVYGQPNTWEGFWDQFFGREAARFIGLPNSVEALLANFNTVNSVLITDLTVPGILVGMLGLILALRNNRQRRMAITMMLSALAAYVFHVAVYTDILSALILPITLSLAFGWLFLADWVFRRFVNNRVRYVAFSPFAVLAVFLIAQNLPFIRDLTTNPTGLQTIALAKNAPPGSVLMLDWGPRHYAVGFARDILGELPNMTLVKHTADFKTLIAEHTLVTPDFTFYNRPVSWWEEQVGTRVYLRAVAAHLVQIDTHPEMAPDLSEDGIQAVSQSLDCTADSLDLHVNWAAATKPDHDLSVFVHLLDANGNVIGQGDEAAPVYGWRPLTTWEAREIVRDIYPLPRLSQAQSIEYGLYRQLPSGEFQNEVVYDMAVNCDA